MTRGLSSVLCGLIGLCLMPGLAQANPDFYISSFKVSVAGRDVTYTATVCNKGTNSVKFTNLKIYYNRPIAPGCGSAYDKIRSVPKLATGTCVTHTVVQYSAAYGNYTAWALANGTCNEGELVESNNAASASYTVQRSDLYIKAFTAKAVDRTVTFNATICNKGSTVTKDIDLELFYDRTVAPGCGSADDQHYLLVGGLGSGTCVTRSFTRTKTPHGNFTAYIFADGDCADTESDETNNTAFAAYKIVQSDLHVSAFTVKVVNQTVTFAATVCNKGASVVKAFDLEIYYDRTSAPGCGSTHSQTFQITKLDAGKCYTHTFGLVSAPFGSFTAWAFADGDCDISEASELDNTLLANYTVSPPDLQVSAFTVKATGTTLDYRVTVCNKGSSISSSFDIDLFYHGTTAPGCGSKRDLYATVSGLATGNCVTLNLKRTATPAGTYASWVLADGGCMITESDETNNGKSLTVSVGKPDLTISALSATAQGATVTYSATLCNSGAAVTTPFVLGLHYNRSSAPGCSDTPDDKTTITSLGGSGSCVTRTFVRQNTKPGAYLAWALADAGCVVAESGETNNNKSLSYLVSSQPDMALPDLAVPDSAVPDLAAPDLAVPDLAPPDSAAPDAGIEAGMDADMAGPDAAGDLPGAEAAVDTAVPDQAGVDSFATDSAPPDVSSPDSASAEGGTVRIITGGGGCDCEMSGDRSGAPTLVLVLLLAGLLWIRRRDGIDRP